MVCILQGTSQIEFVALFTGNRTVRLRKLIQIIITSINSLIAYHNLTTLSQVFDTTRMCNSSAVAGQKFGGGGGQLGRASEI